MATAPAFERKQGLFLCPEAVGARIVTEEYRYLAPFANVAHRRKKRRFSPRDLANKQT